VESYLEKTHHKNRADRVTQGIGPEFKPQHQKDGRKKGRRGVWSRERKKEKEGRRERERKEKREKGREEEER
jgi:hypothetical protein